MELGLVTFADMHVDLGPGGSKFAYQRLQDLLEEIKLADEVGLEVFGVGEHHRPDYAVSSPATVLAAAATLTKNIRLSSAVTVLSSEDPVRVYQQFATVDQLSGGRAEIMAGRGSFIESFPLFGYDLQHYDSLFEEKLSLLNKINENTLVSWKGQHRAAIDKLGVYPRAYQDRIPIWRAVGGSPASAVSAAEQGLPLILAIIGGKPQQFVPFINLYKSTAAKLGRPIEDLQIGINSHMFIAEDSQKAADEFFPTYAAMMNRIGRERGWSPLSRQQFEVSRSEQGALLVGSPQQVIDKILFEYELFGNTRFLGHLSVGTVEHAKVMRAIELFGTVVAPAVRKAVAEKKQKKAPL